MRRHRQTGLWLLAVGLALAVEYTVVTWYGVFENDTGDQVCGLGVPHRDYFFPPYTACGSAGPRYRVTSAFAEYAGAALFILAAAMLISGVVVMIAGRRYQSRLARRPR